MALRYDFYFRQPVTESEMDGAFDGLEQADFAFAIDNIFTGIVSGLEVSEASPPDLTVDVSGPGVAYDNDGQRIAVATTQNVDMSEDDGGTPTTVTTSGNTKVVSLFIQFERELSDPRTDGYSATVYFQRDESYSFSVIQGAEAVIGSEIPPALDPDKILLADIRLEYGTTQILDSHTVGAYDQIDMTTRREDAFKFAGTPVSITEGTAFEAIGALLVALNDHITGAANAHAATAIEFTDTNTWLDGSTLAGATDVDDVQEAIEAVQDDLGSQLIGDDGALRIGKYQTPNLADGSPIATGSVGSVIDGLINALASQSSNGGADRIGAVAQTSGGESLSVGSIFDQLGELLTLSATTWAFVLIARASNYTKTAQIETTSTMSSTNGMTFSKDFDLFMTVGYDASATAERIYTTQNIWYDSGGWMTKIPSAARGTVTSLNCVIFVQEYNGGSGLFLIGGAISGTEAAVQYSADGINFAAVAPGGMVGSSDAINKMAYDPNTGNTVAVGNGISYDIIVTTDGASWGNGTCTNVTEFTDVASDGDSTLLAVGKSTTGYPIAYRSTDGGANWSLALVHNSATGQFNGVAYDPKSQRWFIAGFDSTFSNGIAYRSDAGSSTSFEEIVSDFEDNMSTYVACDGYGAIVFSSFLTAPPTTCTVSVDGGDTFYKVILGDETGDVQINGIQFVAGRFIINDNNSYPILWLSDVAFGDGEDVVSYP